MATVTPTPFVFKDMTLKIDADNYEAAVSKVELAPTTSQVTFKGATPGAVFTDVTAATWVCNVDYAQDWSSTTSLSYYLFNHQGETVEAVFVPKVGVSQPSINVTLVIVPGSIGGTVDQFATSSVTLGVTGEPEFVPSA